MQLNIPIQNDLWRVTQPRPGPKEIMSLIKIFVGTMVSEILCPQHQVVLSLSCTLTFTLYYLFIYLLYFMAFSYSWRSSCYSGIINLHVLQPSILAILLQQHIKMSQVWFNESMFNVYHPRYTLPCVALTPKDSTLYDITDD